MKYDPLDPWPNDQLLALRIENYVKTESIIASILQETMTLEESLYQVTVDDFKNMSKGTKIRNMVK